MSSNSQDTNEPNGATPLPPNTSPTMSSPAIGSVSASANGSHAPNGHPKRMSPPRPLFQDEGVKGDMSNTLSFSHSLPHSNSAKTVENISITLDASTACSPSSSPRQEIKQSPPPRVVSDDANRTRSTSSPTTIGEQLQSTFTPITQAFARLSESFSESILKSSSPASASSTDASNNPPFWKRKGKVPGSVKPAKAESQKPHGFMARPPTPPNDSDNPSHSSPTFSHNKLSPSSSDSDLYRFSNDNPSHSDLHRSDGFDYEHHCLEFKSCGTKVEQSARMEKFTKILSENVVDLEALKKLCWTGIPGEVRAQCWKLLLGYLPANADRRDVTLQRKRKEYFDCIPQYYDVPDSDRTETELKIFRQISIDVPRTNPNVALFQQPEVQKLLERVLYIWAIRHPASGYVQGINDLATPFLVVFLSELVESHGGSVGNLMENIDVCDVSSLPPENVRLVEADSYWCMSKLLDGIQDHYTFAQPGIQRMTHKLKELVGRIDAPLARHLGEQDAQFIQFAFRWMNCLLMREIPLPLISRMWDTYFSEGTTHGFGVFHVYVCAAFLVTWSEELRQREFQDIMLFLQHLPTSRWHCKDVELLLSQAFIWMSVFHNAPSHLK
eukprot:Phypoly_transcript_04612.p1 GENE.Phypoly_transcript_04612~~Phypoly_transcript_04612.p1  ORF type:complete len:612 (+),score=113.67 Phypoly_transcript_04612:185-2020(+)